MVKDIDIGWLAGIIDGEGSVTIVNSYTDNRLHPTVMITNTDLRILYRAQEIMLELGVSNPRIHNHDNRPGKRPSSRLYVGTVLGIQLLLVAVMPQLTSKREQAGVMIEFLRERTGKSARRRYNARDFELAQHISNLNRGRVDSVETARAPRTSNAMIQSELHGDMQSAAEMSAPAKIH